MKEENPMNISDVFTEDDLFAIEYAKSTYESACANLDKVSLMLCEQADKFNAFVKIDLVQSIIMARNLVYSIGHTFDKECYNELFETIKCE